MCSKPGMPSNDEPIQTAKIEPMMNWPWPPMLNRPQRNANATARPVRISGVVWISVCWRLSAAISRSSALVHGKSQLSPVPLKIAAVGRDRVVPGDQHDEPADQEGDEDRDQRRDDAAAAHVGRQPRRDRCVRREFFGVVAHAASARPPPVMYTPKSSSEDSGGSSVTISPS